MIKNYPKILFVILVLAITIGLSSCGTSKKSQPKAWRVIGNAAFTPGTVSDHALFVYQGTPYVAFSDNVDAKIRVMKLQNGAWVNVGSFVSDNDVWYICLYVDNGIPYVAYCDSIDPYPSYVKKLNGTSWETVGSAPFFNEAYDISLYVDNGVPYVSYKDRASGDIGVKKCSGGVWQDVGSPGFAGSGDYTSIYVYNGAPYLAFNGSNVTVMKTDSSSPTGWSQVGTTPISSLQGFYITLQVYNGIPYVAFQDQANGSRLTVKKYVGGNWELLGEAGFTTGEPQYPTLFLDGGNAYVAYYENTPTGSPAIVLKYDGNSTWTPVGEPNFSGDIWDLSLYVYHGTPFISFDDVINDDKLTVMAYK
jgi:hypothetical protein